MYRGAPATIGYRWRSIHKTNCRRDNDKNVYTDLNQDHRHSTHRPVGASILLDAVKLLAVGFGTALVTSAVLVLFFGWVL